MSTVTAITGRWLSEVNSAASRRRLLACALRPRRIPNTGQGLLLNPIVEFFLGGEPGKGFGGKDDEDGVLCKYISLGQVDSEDFRFARVHYL